MLFLMVLYGSAITQLYRWKITQIQKINSDCCFSFFNFTFSLVSVFQNVRDFQSRLNHLFIKEF